MLRVRVLDDARLEYAQAVRWYREEDIDVARDMVSEYVTRVRRARQFPKSGALVATLSDGVEVRRFLLGKFPYSVFVAYMRNELVIVAVAHQHRKPFYWRKRLAKVMP